MEYSKIWNKEKYQEFVKYLFSLQDRKYRDFHSKLILNDRLIGIRTRLLKKIAKDISKTDYKSFIELNKNEYYEEKMIHGLIIGYINDYGEMIECLNNYFPYIDNWALCDLTCSNLKIFKNNLDNGFKYICKLVKSKNPWVVRVGVVLLLDYYIDKKYLNKIFNICNTIQNNDYYVKMAVAWLLSMCYVKFPNDTIIYLNDNLLDDWTYNKTIQKVRESNRIDKETKQRFDMIKRRRN